MSFPAQAHPHVFIDNAVTFVFADSRITAFRANWIFDDVFSDQLLQQFDANHDGALDAKESRAMGDLVMNNVKAFHYFTYVWIDKKQLPPIAPKDFQATAKKGIVTFDFLVPLPKPIDPKTQLLAVEIYDHEFFVEVDLRQKNPVQLDGAGPMSCTPKIRDDKSRAYFGGYVLPQEISLTCK
jgi:ABC-type uncharacterized transport system substrate-binding protein